MTDDEAGILVSLFMIEFAEFSNGCNAQPSYD